MQKETLTEGILLLLTQAATLRPALCGRWWLSGLRGVGWGVELKFLGQACGLFGGFRVITYCSKGCFASESGARLAF